MSKKKGRNKNMKAVMEYLLSIIDFHRENLVGEVSTVEVVMKIKVSYSIIRFAAYDNARNCKIISFYSYEPREVANDVLIHLENILSWKKGCCLNDVQKLRDRKAWTLTFWRDR